MRAARGYRKLTTHCNDPWVLFANSTKSTNLYCIYLDPCSEQFFLSIYLQKKTTNSNILAATKRFHEFFVVFLFRLSKIFTLLKLQQLIFLFFIMSGFIISYRTFIFIVELISFTITVININFVVCLFLLLLSFMSHRRKKKQSSFNHVIAIE